jgi:hypothetical protein
MEPTEGPLQRYLDNAIELAERANHRPHTDQPATAIQMDPSPYETKAV